MHIGRFIRESRVPVVINGDCLSACFFIYISAVERTVNENYRIGIHRPYFDKGFYSNLSADNAEALYSAGAAESEAYLKEMGTPQSVIEKMFKTGSNAMFYLDRDLANEIFGWRAPFYDEWITAKCGEYTQLDFELVLYSAALREIRTKNGEARAAELIEKYKGAALIDKAGILEKELADISRKIECYKHGDNDGVWRHFTNNRNFVIKKIESRKNKSEPQIKKRPI